MIRTTLRTGLALLLLLLLSAGASAAEPCFSPEDPALMGICITRVPEQGCLRLGSRILRPGDVLTARQAAAMEFEAAGEAPVCFSYLPVSQDGTGETEVLSLGKQKNQAPIAEDSAAETYKNLENTGRLKVRDPEEAPLTFTLVREPRRGTVTFGSDGSFTYTPKKNKVGTDSFVYTAADPEGNISREATVTIEILKPTDAPQYVDTAGRSCRFAAEWMKHTGLFAGETLSGAPCFQPDRAVTKGEFLAMLVKALKLEPETGLDLPRQLETVPGWFRPYLAAALRSGLLAAIPEQDSLGSPITGEEAAAMLLNGLDLPVPQAAEASAPEEGSPALSALARQGIFLEAQAALTRGQAAELLYVLTGAPE